MRWYEEYEKALKRAGEMEDEESEESGEESEESGEESEESGEEEEERASVRGGREVKRRRVE